MKTREELIKDLEEMVPGFSKKAATLFKAGGFTWGDDFNPRIPSEEEISEMALALIQYLRGGSLRCSTGRITAFIEPAEDGLLEGGLAFSYSEEVYQ